MADQADQADQAASQPPVLKFWFGPGPPLTRDSFEFQYAQAWILHTWLVRYFTERYMECPVAEAEIWAQSVGSLLRDHVAEDFTLQGVEPCEYAGKPEHPLTAKRLMCCTVQCSTGESRVVCLDDPSARQDLGFKLELSADTRRILQSLGDLAHQPQLP